MNKYIKQLTESLFDDIDDIFSDDDEYMEISNTLDELIFLKTNNIVNTLLKEHKISLDDLKYLHTKTVIQYKVKDEYELNTIIQELVKVLKGYNQQSCSLNWIDISLLTKLEDPFHQFYTNMTNIFWDISKWNTHNIRSMKNLFAHKNNICDISNWDVSNVEDMSYMFNGCKTFNLNLNKWNVSKVKTMRCMFAACENFNQDLNKWDVSNVKDFSEMFYNCKNFNGNISTWNTKSARQMTSMFLKCTNFNSDISKWNVSNVTSFFDMFKFCTNFNSDISNWQLNTNHDIQCNYMFYDCEKFNLPIQKWNISKIKSFNGFLYGCRSFIQDLSSWNLTDIPSVNFINVLTGIYKYDHFKPKEITEWDFILLLLKYNIFNVSLDNFEYGESFSSEETVYPVLNNIYLNEDFLLNINEKDYMDGTDDILFFDGTDNETNEYKDYMGISVLTDSDIYNLYYDLIDQLKDKQLNPYKHMDILIKARILELMGYNSKYAPSASDIENNKQYYINKYLMHLNLTENDLKLFNWSLTDFVNFLKQTKQILSNNG